MPHQYPIRYRIATCDRFPVKKSGNNEGNCIEIQKLFSAAFYTLAGVVTVLSDGILLPAVAAIGAATNVFNTQSMLYKKRDELQKTLDECRRDKIESEVRLESTRSEVMSTLSDREMASQPLETLALQVTFFKL